MRILLVFLFISLSFGANNLDFTLIKKGDTNSSSTMLLLGGIQGDEPGGFMAANLVAKHYKIKKGSLWVIPNLNFDSIIKRSRGDYGDMNRKFAKLSPKDKDFDAIVKIKKIIQMPNIDIIVHLHDGSGFYREKYYNQLINPNRWGNSCIIDQEILEGSAYPNLLNTAQSTADYINSHLENSKYFYHVKNTQTALGDEEMLKSLTYFAVLNKKSAFANEASKNFNLENRVYVHLLAVENYLKTANIEFTRDFKLDPKSIKEVINEEIFLNLNDNKFVLLLDNPRPSINYVPMQKDSLKYQSDNALVALIKNGKCYKVHYGNNVLTKICPQYFEFSDMVKSAKVVIDDEIKEVKFGSIIKAQDYILIKAQNNVRVNAIGYENNALETDVKIHKNDFRNKFSIDKAGKIFRIEFYDTSKNDDKYLGMFLVKYEKNLLNQKVEK